MNKCKFCLDSGKITRGIETAELTVSKETVYLCPDHLYEYNLDLQIIGDHNYWNTEVAKLYGGGA